MTFDRDVQGRPWEPCAGCPHPTPAACPSRAHRAFCGHVADDPGHWRAVVASLPAETRPPRDLVAPWHPPVTWPCPDGRPRVGFLGPYLNTHGGTETWHRTLWPGLESVQPVGYAVTHREPDADLAGVPIGSGIDNQRSLAATVDVLVAWGDLDWAALLPAERPPVVVWVSHGTGEWTHQSARKAAPHVTHWVAVSRTAAAACPGEAVVLWNGCDRPTTADRQPPTTADNRRQPPTRTALYVGRLSGEKRPRLAADAVALLPGWELVVAGAGAERASLEGLPHVRLLGRREDIGDLLHAADVLVMPSAEEGFGLSALEAFHAGVPVVGAKVGILADVPGLARTLPVASGPEAWAWAIRETAEHRATVEIAGAWAATHATAGAFRRRWDAFLASVVPEGPELPSVWRMARGFAATAAAVVASGGEEADADTQAARWALCRRCDHFRPTDQRCGKASGCGCFLASKIGFKAAQCPVGRW